MKCEKCGNDDIKFEFSVGKISCKLCGFVIEEGILNPEISFNQSGYGKKTANGQILKNLTRKTICTVNKTKDFFLTSAKRKINQLCNTFKLNLRFQDSAIRLFILALHRGIIQGRKLQALCISCIYVICRREKTSHLLVDFSDIIQTRSSKIGGIFLKFVQHLNISLPVIDPSLFVHRFATSLKFGNKTNLVARSALRLIARMKRDWMSTGRRPSGLCGAALLIASRMHGMERSQKEISEIVRIGNIVLRSRLREMDKTSTSCLTVYEIDKGGGDDGNKESLLDNFVPLTSLPPSRQELSLNFEILKEKDFYYNKHNSNKLIVGKKKNVKKNSLTKNKSENYPPDVSMYLNTNLEIHIKKDVWSENNLNFICSQSIIARAQKEKPFAFFRMGKKFKAV
nr:TFIIB related factor hBRF [Cryptomonas sp.]